MDLSVKCLFSAALIAIISRASCFGETRNNASVTVKTRLNSETGSSLSLSAGDTRYRACYMYFDQSDSRVFSVYTPYAAAGKIKSKGLLREIKNPAGQYPGSAVFSESCGIVPDSSFSTDGSRGFMAGAGEVFSLFAEKSGSENGNLDWYGFYGTVRMTDWLKASCAVTDYSERDDSTGDFWYSDRMTGYRRDVRNTAMSISLGNTAAGIECAASSSRADGALKENCYWRVSPYAAVSFFRVDLLAVCTGRYFIKPDGSFPAVMLRKGILVTATPLYWTLLRYRYTTDVFHERPKDSHYGGYDEESYASVTLSPFFLYGMVFARNLNRYREERLENTLDTGFSAGLKSRNGKIVFERKTRHCDEKLFSETCRIEAGLRKGIYDLYLLGRKVNSENPETKIKLQFGLRGKNTLVTAGLSETFAESPGGASRRFSEYSAGLDARF